MKKEISENEVKRKAEIYCASAERCSGDVERKLEQWGVAPETAQNVIRYLLGEKYIDPARFCAAFVRDKYRFNRWGRHKIVRALQQKGFSDEQIATGLEKIDEREYMEILSGVLEQKKRSLKVCTTYERDGKLLRFATTRGFEPEAVFRWLKQSNTDEAHLD